MGCRIAIIMVLKRQLGMEAKAKTVPAYTHRGDDASGEPCCDRGQPVGEERNRAPSILSITYISISP